MEKLLTLLNGQAPGLHSDFEYIGMKQVESTSAKYTRSFNAYVYRSSNIIYISISIDYKPDQKKKEKRLVYMFMNSVAKLIFWKTVL